METSISPSQSLEMKAIAPKIKAFICVYLACLNDVEALGDGALLENRCRALCKITNMGTTRIVSGAFALTLPPAMPHLERRINYKYLMALVTPEPVKFKSLILCLLEYVGHLLFVETLFVGHEIPRLRSDSQRTLQNINETKSANIR